MLTFDRNERSPWPESANNSTGARVRGPARSVSQGFEKALRPGTNERTEPLIQAVDVFGRVIGRIEAELEGFAHDLLGQFASAPAADDASLLPP